MAAFRGPKTVLRHRAKWRPQIGWAQYRAVRSAVRVRTWRYHRLSAASSIGRRARPPKRPWDGVVLRQFPPYWGYAPTTAGISWTRLPLTSGGEPESLHRAIEEMLPW